MTSVVKSLQAVSRLEKCYINATPFNIQIEIYHFPDCTFTPTTLPLKPCLLASKLISMLIMSGSVKLLFLYLGKEGDRSR